VFRGFKERRVCKVLREFKEFRELLDLRVRLVLKGLLDPKEQLVLKGLLDPKVHKEQLDLWQVVMVKFSIRLLVLLQAHLI
jgi:hypothetical protein